MSNTDSVDSVMVVARGTWSRVLLAHFTSSYCSTLVLEGADCCTDAAVFHFLLQGVYGTAW